MSSPPSAAPAGPAGSHRFLRWLGALALLLIGLLITARVGAAPALPGPLVGAAWLQQHLTDPDLLVLDASPGPMHKAAHIPGAVNADIFTYAMADLPPAEMQKRLRAWGLRAGQRIVIYDEGGAYFAPRVFFDLVYNGVPATQLAVLDGGLAKWRETGGAVTAEATVAREGDIALGARDEGVRVRLPEFLAATGDRRRHAVIEALEPEWHFGANAFFDRAGHVPHALMWPRETFFNADKTFKSADEIRRIAAHLGIRPEQQVLAHCGGGLAAAVPFFALKALAGYPDVRLFHESQLGWLRDDRMLPFWTYDAPWLVRDAQWLKAWAGRMARMYGIGRTQVIDVRPPEDYAQGHLAFASHLPAAQIVANLGDPARLGELLRAAGADPASEMVIVSGRGIDEGAALAFSVLDDMGYSRVSVLLDGTLTWAERGLELVKDAAPAAARPAPVPTPNGRLWRGEVPRAAGAMPRVVLASGKAAPTRHYDAPVVHVPAASLVNAEGTPKPAKEIWAALAKAGLPRFAEIVVVGDTPGEAAMNYLLLRLMGFADVKLRVD